MAFVRAEQLVMPACMLSSKIAVPRNVTLAVYIEPIRVVARRTGAAQQPLLMSDRPSVNEPRMFRNAGLGRVNRPIRSISSSGCFMWSSPLVKHLAFRMKWTSNFVHFTYGSAGPGTTVSKGSIAACEWICGRTQIAATRYQLVKSSQTLSGQATTKFTDMSGVNRSDGGPTLSDGDDDEHYSGHAQRSHKPSRLAA